MTIELSAMKREALLAAMERETFDLLVIGGGITGAGIALDAAARGMRTALVEMQDFAAGTSSRSTKLIHGGLRYLKQLDVQLVAEAGRERAVVYANAPHVTTPIRMLLPLYRGGSLGRLSASAGLWLYDRLAGVKREERRRMLGRVETLALEPLLREEGLVGGGEYVEYRTDDARLTLEVVKRAADEGAYAVNYAAAERFVYDGEGRLAGAEISDRLGGGTYVVRARRIVNAAGPWADRLHALDEPGVAPAASAAPINPAAPALRLTKGIHLVFDGSRLPVRHAVYFDGPDGRLLFAVPRGGKTYVGTTDTDYGGDPAHPGIDEADAAYVVQAANYVFPGARLTPADAESGWAGLRPLIRQPGRAPSEVSRRDELFRSASGLITIAGGKLTGYRKMAEKAVDIAALELTAEGAGPFGPCATERLRLAGAPADPAELPQLTAEWTAAGERLGLPREDAARIAARYGANAPAVHSRLPAAREAAGRYALPEPLAAELLYAIEREMAATPADFLVRRTGDAAFDIAAARRHQAGVCAFMAERLAWNPYTAGRHASDLARELHPLPHA